MLKMLSLVSKVQGTTNQSVSNSGCNLLPKWHHITYVVHYIGNSVSFGTQTVELGVVQAELHVMASYCIPDCWSVI